MSKRTIKILEVEAAGFVAAKNGLLFDDNPYEASMYNPGNRYLAPLRRAWEKGYRDGLRVMEKLRRDELIRQRGMADHARAEFLKWQRERGLEGSPEEEKEGS